MWVTELAMLQISAHDYSFGWLNHRGQLSNALQACCAQVTVQVIAQHMSSAFEYPDEPRCWVRQVYLYGDEIPWVFARVVAPFMTYCRYKRQLDALGNNLLGATFLSKLDNLVRAQPLFAYVPPAIQHHCRQSKIARKTQYCFADCELLVTEAFLPEIAAYPFD